MGSFLYTLALILVVIWAVGFVGYNASSLIHVLLIIAISVVLLRLIQRKDYF